MWIDVATLIFAALLMVTGFRRGALSTFLSMFTLIGAYAIAYWLAPDLGPWVAERLGLSDLAARAGASFAIFCGAYLVLALVSYFVRGRARRRGPRGLGD